MSEYPEQRVKPKYLWFRISTALGLSLGLLLLVQTLRTYYYVSQSLVRQEAQREADRRMQSIGRAARLTGSREPATLAPVLRELVHESPQQLAWIRILDMDGKVLTESDPVVGAPSYKPGQLGKMLEDRGRAAEERETRSGKVLVVVNPMRFGPPAFERRGGPPPGEEEGRGPDGPGRDNGGNGRRGGRGPGRGAPQLAEIGLYFDGVSANFLPLRENLIVGCAAAIALIGAVIIIALRFRHYMRGRHIEEELSLARRVQNDLFPTGESPSGMLSFAAKCVPAYQVGGDLYDVFETDDGEVGLVLGDVSGKGLPAALLMGVVQGAVRASCITGPASSHEQSTERLNHLLCMKTARERFVSLFWCYVDRSAAVLRYVNAGHLPPLLIRQRQGAASEVQRLDSGGPVLGLLPGARYRQAEVPIQAGDLLIVFSDGILEAANSRDEEFGEEGVLASVERHRDMPPTELCAAILDDVRAFLGKELPQDDQTLLVVRLDVAGSISPLSADFAAIGRA